MHHQESNWKWWRWGDVGQGVQTPTYKINTTWGSGAQLGGYNEQYCIIYLNVLKTS